MTVVVTDSPTRVIVRGDQVSVVTVGIQGPPGVDGAAGGGIGISAGVSAITTGTAILSNSNNVSFGMSNGVVTASASYPAQTQIVLSNSNGISFGTNGSTVTASYTVPVQSVQPGIQSISGGTTRATTGEVVFSNSNNVSFGVAGNTITGSASFSQSVQTQSVVQGISAGTQVGRTGDIVFSNSNGISFGLSGSNTVTASYTVPTVTNSSMTVSDFATSGTVGRLAFTNLNGVTLSLSTGAGGSHTIVGSHNALTSQSNQAFSASGGSSAFQTLSFNNANGATFSNVGGAVQLSYTVPTQSAQTIGVYGSSQTTGQSSSSTVDARSLTFRGAGNVSVGMSGGEVIISATGGGGGGGGIAAAAGTQTATSGTVNFANSNGISFGMSGSSQVTASYTVPSTAGLISAVNVSAGTTSNNLSAVTFSNSNGLAFGLNGSVVTGSYTVPTVTNSSFTVSDAGTSGTVGRLAFTNLNGVTLSLSTGAGGSHTIVGSHNALTSQSNQAFSASGGSSAFQTLNFANSNGLTFSNSNGSVIASYTVPSTAGLLSAINLSAGTTSSNLSAVTFSNSNGLAFGLNGSVITGSYTVPTQSDQTIGVYAVSNTTGASSSSTIDARSLIFQGAGVASVGMTNGSVVISVPVGGGAGDGGVGISAGTTSVSNGTVLFSNANNVTFGLDGSTVTASASFNQTIPLYRAFEPKPMAGLQVMVASSLLMQRVTIPANISATVLDLCVGVSGSASAGATLTYTAAAYTMNGSTLSLASSGTVTYGYNSTAAASSYTAISATRYHSLPVTWNMTPGEYMVGFIFNSTSSGTVGTYSVVGNASQITMQQLPFGGGNRTYAPIYGVYSAATTAPPSSIHLTQVVQTSNVAIRPPWFALAGTF